MLVSNFLLVGPECGSVPTKIPATAGINKGIILPLKGMSNRFWAAKACFPNGSALQMTLTSRIIRMV